MLLINGSMHPDTIGSMNLLDRCDRCSAQAQVEVKLFSGGELVFCGHHYAQHEEELDLVSLKVIDSRAALV